MNDAYATRAFCPEKPLVVRVAYRATFPLLAVVMKRKMGINAENAARALERTRQAFDYVVKEAENIGSMPG